MAMAKMGAGIVEINGRFGGNVFRTDVCGQHIQATPRTVSYERSVAQKKRQRAFRASLNYIRTHATPLFVALWQQYANNHPKVNKKGETIILSWWQSFMSINIVRLFNDVDILQYPPEG